MCYRRLKRVSDTTISNLVGILVRNPNIHYAMKCHEMLILIDSNIRRIILWAVYFPCSYNPNKPSWAGVSNYIIWATSTMGTIASLVAPGKLLENDIHMKKC